MDKIKTALAEASVGKHSSALMYGSVIAMALSGIIPTPANMVYYFAEKKYYQQWKAKEITAQQYWEKSAFAKEATEPIWWMLVLTGMFFVPGDAAKKAKVGIALVAAGTIAGFVYSKHIKSLEFIRKEAFPEPTISADGASTKKKPQMFKVRR